MILRSFQIKLWIVVLTVSAAGRYRRRRLLERADDGSDRSRRLNSTLLLDAVHFRRQGSLSAALSSRITAQLLLAMSPTASAFSSAALGFTGNAAVSHPSSASGLRMQEQTQTGKPRAANPKHTLSRAERRQKFWASKKELDDRKRQVKEERVVFESQAGSGVQPTMMKTRFSALEALEEEEETGPEEEWVFGPDMSDREILAKVLGKDSSDATDSLDAQPKDISAVASGGRPKKSGKDAQPKDISAVASGGRPQKTATDISAFASGGASKKVKFSLFQDWEDGGDEYDDEDEDGMDGMLDDEYELDEYDADEYDEGPISAFDLPAASDDVRGENTEAKVSQPQTYQPSSQVLSTLLERALESLKKLRAREEPASIDFKEGDTIMVQLTYAATMGIRGVTVPSGFDTMLWIEETGFFPEDGSGLAGQVGDVVPAYIVEKREDGLLTVSFRPFGGKAKLQDGAQKLLDALVESKTGSIPFGDKSSAVEIRQAFGLSKKNFKEARGKLLKAGYLAHPLPPDQTVLAANASESSAKKPSKLNRKLRSDGDELNEAHGLVLMGLPQQAAAPIWGADALLKMLRPYGRVRSLRGLVSDGAPTGCAVAFMDSLDNALEAVEGLQRPEMNSGVTARLLRPSETVSKVVAMRERSTDDRTTTVWVAWYGGMEQNEAILDASKDEMEQELRKMFSVCGKCKVGLASDPQTEQLVGFGHIVFDDPDAAESALRLRGAELRGQRLRIELSETKFKHDDFRVKKKDKPAKQKPEKPWKDQRSIKNPGRPEAHFPQKDQRSVKNPGRPEANFARQNKEARSGRIQSRNARKEFPEQTARGGSRADNRGREANRQNDRKNPPAKGANHQSSMQGRAKTVKCYVGNLPPDASALEIWELFSQCGPIELVDLPKDSESGKTRGIARIEFEKPEAVDAALRLKSAQIRGHTLRIEQSAFKKR